MHGSITNSFAAAIEQFIVKFGWQEFSRKNENKLDRSLVEM
jgi:hypothetical protein